MYFAMVASRVHVSHDPQLPLCPLGQNNCNPSAVPAVKFFPQVAKNIY